MDRRIEAFIAFWLTLIVFQRNLFHRIWKDIGLIIKTIFFKVIEGMKKVLYIVARGRHNKNVGGKDTAHPPEQQIPASTTKDSATVATEHPIPDPMVASKVEDSTKEIETEEYSGSDADVVIKLEMPMMQGDITLAATYHLAVMDKLNTILDENKHLKERINNMALNIDSLREEVTRAKTVHASAVTLIEKVHGELTAIRAELVATLALPVDTSALDALTADLKASTDSLAVAVTDSLDVKPEHSVVLNADNPELATVEVVVPEVIPEVVEAHVEQVVETVDVTSTEPQLVITVEEAAIEIVEVVEATAPEVVSNPDVNLALPEGGEIVTGVVTTDEGEVDVVVAITPEETAVAVSAGVDVVEAVQEAYDTTPPEVVAEPLGTDFGTTPETGGAPSEGLEGTQSGQEATKPTE